MQGLQPNPRTFHPTPPVLRSAAVKYRIFRYWTLSFCFSQEIDKVHSLTLGKIIRLNTGYKSAPDNVFFSAEYCAGVENFQCVPHNETPTGSCENMQRKLRTLQQDLEKSKQACDGKRSKADAAASIDAVDTVLIVLCVLFFLLAVLFLFLFLRAWLLLRRSVLDNVNGQKDFGLELRNKSQKESEIYQNAFGDFIMSREGWCGTKLSKLWTLPFFS